MSQQLTKLEMPMSEDTKNKRGQAEAAKAEPPKTSKESSEILSTRILHGVTIVRRSNLGPISVHSTGSSDKK